MAGILMVAAETGNINGLYASIKVDPKVLDDIDDIPFVDTPLHTAASRGHTDFALEILRLKPSFGRKLNPDGLSSLHLALRNDKFETVKQLIKFDKELIRIKGREGVTPLHFIAKKASDGDQKRMDDPINADQQQGGTDEQQRALPNIEQEIVADDRVNILAEFLFACPNSVEDLTIRDQTALHIAVKSNNQKAVAIILGCIRKIGRKRVLDYKDKEGNTALGMAVDTSQDVGTYEAVFLQFYYLNTLAFGLSMLMIMFALPFGPFALLHLALYSLMMSYGLSFSLISPSNGSAEVLLKASFVCALLIYSCRNEAYQIFLWGKVINKRLRMLERLLKNVEQ